MNNNVAKVINDVSFGAVVCTFMIVVYKMSKRAL